MYFAPLTKPVLVFDETFPATLFFNFKGLSLVLCSVGSGSAQDTLRMP